MSTQNKEVAKSSKLKTFGLVVGGILLGAAAAVAVIKYPNLIPGKTEAE